MNDVLSKLGKYGLIPVVVIDDVELAVSES